MLFPFTFTSLLPDTLNPFSYLYSTMSSGSQQADPDQSWAVVTHRGDPHRRPHRPPRCAFRESRDHTYSPPRQVGYKRGWEPSIAPSTTAKMNSRFAAGDFDTPSKYLHAASRPRKRYGRSEANRISDPEPPNKRRRLGETIISTALSAALIGTAVGLTAYRLWRDRGKVTEFTPAEDIHRPPPPPYEETRQWTAEPPVDERPAPPIEHPPAVDAPKVEAPRPPSPTPSTATSATAVSVSARSETKSPQKPRPQTPKKKPTRPKRLTVRRSSPALRSQTSFMSMAAMEEPLAADDEDHDEVDEHMDWMSERLRGLIEQGKQALGKEIVIQDDTVGMVDEHTGLEDDGSHDWEDDHAAPKITPPTRHAPSSFRNPHKRAAPPSSFSAPGSRTLSRQTSMYGMNSDAPRSLSRMPSTVSLNRASIRASAPPTIVDRNQYCPPPSLSRMSSTASLNRASIRANTPSTIADRNQYWQHPSTHTVDDDISGASPELRGFMEEARKARQGAAS
ncbi:uncharacterized protein EI90DRAFT_1818848 [Cantharellus anzutake]|uniref:uncharacterized protein n=1 Tax=Cantharellus anzutake TaxID=1750568 RepID=UPI001903C4F0|nr:uncharacterized protein EI90DRAFT_1818848 [Cantharellus anzutake]KAF8327149.1 hypothetical protein EI90DRAFT_1818848 [Cantharellus anzutake]